MEYRLIYETIGDPPNIRQRHKSHDINELINLADEEPGQYDGCYIMYGDRIVWEPSLGYLYDEHGQPIAP